MRLFLLFGVKDPMLLIQHLSTGLVLPVSSTRMQVLQNEREKKDGDRWK
jgi:hypothetical protein